MNKHYIECTSGMYVPMPSIALRRAATSSLTLKLALALMVPLSPG